MELLTSDHDDLNVQSYIFKPINLSHLDVIKILIIDDTKKEAQMLEDMLAVESNMNFSCTHSSHPNEALQMVENNLIKPDLIVLDYIMPSVNGSSALQALRNIKHSEELPVVVNSSMHHYDNIIKFKNLRANAFFAKPIDIQAFEKFIRGEINI